MSRPPSPTKFAPMSNDVQHYYSNAARQQVGPVSRDDLQAAILAPDWHNKAMIWREGWEKWLPWPEAARVLGLRMPTVGAAVPQRDPPPLLPESAQGDTDIQGERLRAASPAANPHRYSDNFYASPSASVMTVAKSDFDYASFWTRLAAYLIDRVILIVIMIGIVAVTSMIIAGLGLGGTTKGGADAGALIIVLAAAIAFIAMPAAYFVYFEQSQSGMTPGKRLFGIRVADLDGDRISIGASFLRNLVAAISGAFYCVGHVVAAFTERHQALHDLAAKTIVIHVTEPSRDASGGQRRRSGAGVGAIVVVLIAFFMIPVFAIMAAIALPAYQDYTIRAKVAGVVADTAALRSEVQDFRISNGNQCPSNSDQPFQDATAYQGQHYTSVELSSRENSAGDLECLLSITLDNAQPTTLDRQVLTLALSPDQRWTCGSDTISERYMPSSCRAN